MRLHSAGSVVVGSGARATGDRLVVLVTLVAESEVVHRSLRGRLHAQRAVERVNDTLGGLYVAGCHRVRRRRVEQRALGYQDPQRSQASGVERQRLVDQRAEDVQHRGHGHRPGGVEVVPLLRRGSREVDRGGPRLLVDRDADSDDLPVVEFVAKASALESAEHVAHALLGVVLHVTHVGEQRIASLLAGRARQLPDATGVGCQLGPQVGEVLLRVARRPARRSQQREHPGFVQHPVAHDPGRGQQHALLIDRATVGRHRAGRDPADVGMVSPRRDEEIDARLRFVEHRADDGDVGQVRATVVRRVDQERIPGPDVGAVRREHRGDAGPHRSEVHRHVRGVRHQVGAVVEYRA